jgi:type VI secretion system protein ImpB
MEDFEPLAVAKHVPAHASLLETRDKLRDLLSKAARSQELENLLEQVLRSEKDLQSLSGDLGIKKAED